MASADDVYTSARSVRWSEHLSVKTRFSVEFRGQTNFIKNTHFGALKVKDALLISSEIEMALALRLIQSDRTSESWHSFQKGG